MYFVPVLLTVYVAEFIFCMELEKNVTNAIRIIPNVCTYIIMHVCQLTNLNMHNSFVYVPCPYNGTPLLGKTKWVILTTALRC